MPISLSPKQIGLSSSRSCLPSQSLAPIWWHLKETELGQGTPRHAEDVGGAENSDGAGAKNIAQRHGGVGAGHATRRTSAARERLAMALENIGAAPWGCGLEGCN